MNAPVLDTGNTAWMLTSTALVLFMTLPGLALFYGGLVRTKNVLSVLMQCFSIASIVTVLWVAIGYSLVFTPGASPALNAIIGGTGKSFLAGVTRASLSGSIPETVFAMYQLTFAIITPALIIGAFAERVGFAPMLLVSAIWAVLVYFPVAHWIWGGGWLQRLGLSRGEVEEAVVPRDVAYAGRGPFGQARGALLHRLHGLLLSQLHVSSTPFTGSSLAGPGMGKPHRNGDATVPPTIGSRLMVRGYRR